MCVAKRPSDLLKVHPIDHADNRTVIGLLPGFGGGIQDAEIEDRACVRFTDERVELVKAGVGRELLDRVEIELIAGELCDIEHLVVARLVAVDDVDVGRPFASE